MFLKRNRYLPNVDSLSTNVTRTFDLVSIYFSLSNMIDTLAISFAMSNLHVSLILIPLRNPFSSPFSLLDRYPASCSNESNNNGLSSDLMSHAVHCLCSCLAIMYSTVLSLLHSLIGSNLSMT